MIAKSLDGIIAVPEWADTIESAGIAIDRFRIDKVFPAMAQAILASDKIIKERPAAVRGFVKAVLGERGELLGMHVVGPYASEMIGAACVMIENEMRARDIQEVIFPHPTVAEIMRDVMFS